MSRRDQYKRKLEFIVDKISSLPKNLEENEYYVDALFYRLQVSIDAAMDVIAMLCKDLGISVKDNYSNMEELDQLNIFTADFLRELRRWNGLRNVIVHRYNKIEEDLVVKEKDNVVKTLKDFVKIIEDVLNERFKPSEES